MTNLRIASSPAQSSMTPPNGGSIMPDVPFKYSQLSKSLITASIWVNDFFKSEFLKQALKDEIGHYKFDMADINANDFVIIFHDTIIKFIPVVHIEVKWSWYKSVYAWVNSGQRDTIFLNSRNVKRSVPSLAGTLAHEFIHVLDAYSPKTFGHGDNRPEGKEMTLPYWIGKKCKEYVEMKIKENNNKLQ